MLYISVEFHHTSISKHDIHRRNPIYSSTQQTDHQTHTSYLLCPISVPPNKHPTSTIINKIVHHLTSHLSDLLLPQHYNDLTNATSAKLAPHERFYDYVSIRGAHVTFLISCARLGSRHDMWIYPHAFLDWMAWFDAFRFDWLVGDLLKMFILCRYGSTCIKYICVYHLPTKPPHKIQQHTTPHHTYTASHP